MIGGAGIDTASYSGAAAGVTMSLMKGVAGAGDAAGDTFKSIENVTGSSLADSLSGNLLKNTILGEGGDDLLFGNAGIDTLKGGADNDTLDGGAGKDTLDGGDGNDRLIGGADKDTLTGGLGNDTFVLSAIPTANDTITDYEVGFDHLEISAAAFNGTTGDLDATTGLTAAQYEETADGLATAVTTRFILNTTTGALHFDSNGSNGEITSNRVVVTMSGDLSAFSISDIILV